MRQALKYLLFLLIIIAPKAFAHGHSDLVAPSDTLRLMAMNERVREAGVSSEFQIAWSTFNASQQEKILDQVTQLLNSNKANRKIFSAYFSALAHAVNTEAIEAQKLTDFLNVTDKVISGHPASQLLAYLRAAETFFKYHALFYARSNQLLAFNDDYFFAYIEDEAPLPETDVVEDSSTEADDYFDEWDQEPAEDDWNTEWNEGDVENESEEEQLVEAIRGAAILPIIQGPVIKFNQVTLNFSTPYDSVFLEDTKGSFLMLKSEFVGDGGKFDWSMAGLPADSVFCNFTTYSFDVQKPKLMAEGASLTYKGRLLKPVEGVFEYQNVRHDTTTDSSYPRFISYYSDIRVRGLGEGVVYNGGFSLNGPKLNSTSVMGEISSIFVHNKGIQKFKARTNRFQFGDSTILARRAALVIYQGNDSIYHPAVRMKYDFKNKQLTVQKDDGNFRNTPYTATYFSIDFTADIIRWDLESDSLDASILDARRIVPAYFESSDHYNLEDYRSLGDKIYPFNPMVMVVAFSRDKKKEKFYVDELARHYKKDVLLLKGAMAYLAQKGLIGYDTKTTLVTVKSKAFHLYDAKLGRKDFDNIMIRSVIHNKPNATLNFKKQYMRIRGVDGFKISDSLNVIIKPDSSEITLLGNRDFMFDGKITAGKFEYIGRDFTFKYDSFLIYLNEIDSIQFYVNDENSRGNSNIKKVDNSLISSDSVSSTDIQNNLQSSSGTLYINRSNNKSAKEKLTNYPKFDSGKGAIVYFDRKDILNGAYRRSVYFIVPPFGIDSLSGSDPSSVGFEGTFVTSGMLPPFEERLGIMEDFSLGFSHNVPADGYQLYEGEGRFFNHLLFNKKGLVGNGRIDFLTTTLESDNFLFYPDSVVAKGEQMQIREEEYNGIIFPNASVTNYKMQWLPRKDSMYIFNLDDPISFYNDRASLDGKAIISEKGVYGSGTLLTRGSESKSDDITFEHNRFSARHANFELKSDNPEKPALAGNDVRLRFNLDEKFADISPEVEGEAAFEFPYAQFKTSITQARWDLDKQKIMMKKPDDVPLESSYFYTTRKDLDSLRFNATGAVYDINTLELKVTGIPYITVADARITPENNEVLILENARIGRLTNTTIILDTLNAYHRLTEGVIDVISRNEFSGYATYQFVNSLNDTIPVKMENFHLEKTPVEGARKKEAFEQHTVANGSVSETQSIVISPGMIYKGDMTLYAHKPAMELEGYVKLAFDDPDYNTWIAHSSSGDQTEVMINFNKAVTEEGQKLEAGIHFSAGDNSLYGNFVAEKYMPGDDNFFIPEGVLFFDKEKNEYAIEDTAKTSGNSLSGKVFRYNYQTKDIRFEGPVHFMRSTKDISIRAAALGEGNLDSGQLKLNTFIAMDLATVPSQAFDIMAMDVLDVVNNLGAPEGLGDQTQLLYKLAEIIGERATREYELASLQTYVPLNAFGKETAVPLVFSNVDLAWSSTHNAFYSEGKLGLSNIEEKDINAAFDGFLELKKNEGGGIVFNLFLKASPDSWYFFSLEDDRLLTFSSNSDYNNVISRKSNGSKAKIGELVFAPADEAETLNFINRFRLQYYGIDESYNLSSQVEEVADEVEDDGFGGTEKNEDVDTGDDGF